MAKPVVLVIGASGNVGSATVQTLSAKYADKLDIRAGTRNPDKAEKLKGLAGVTVVPAEMGAKDSLAAILRGVDALYMVTPSAENRGELVIATAEAAKEAGVKFISVVSGVVTGTDTIIGRQFTTMESGISALGVPYAFLRLPNFVENYFAFKATIVSDSAIYGPVDPAKPFAAATVGDIGKASAAILANPSQHNNKTYNILSDRHTFTDVAAAFSAALGREIKYIRVPYETAKRPLTAMGIPEWVIDSGMEANRLIDDSSPVMNPADMSHFEQITGEKPTDLKTWVNQFAGAFKA